VKIKFYPGKGGHGHYACGATEHQILETIGAKFFWHISVKGLYWEDSLFSTKTSILPCSHKGFQGLETCFDQPGISSFPLHLVFNDLNFQWP
jgi:hypothetical protein